ncbi:PadR family transcriptional regulator [Acrocarpospora pleiomorpha]|uniref:PadR family transcriptional regulator n=1 Tax=Acrocarpospora pleiomorpha TaxID=90975 RepID=A0A5M3XG90_9ACTN|nr:PadR family transcriptional regulator [Acrocarpospora pleiomorpha]GES17993.1 PadR family transcriptional regulator [Acrocarpospora pleiomorpha]
MPLSHAVLALLADGPSHGYELKTRFEAAVGPQWGGLNIGHLYQILDRLVRDGHVAQSDRPDKTLYQLTEASVGVLTEWAATPWVRSSGFRDELFLKLLAATRLGKETLSAFVSAQRQSYLSDLAGLTRLRREENNPLVALLIDAAIAHTKADLQIVEGADQRLAELVHAFPLPRDQHGEQVGPSTNRKRA